MDSKKAYKNSYFIFQIFHGVWTIAFFCLNILETRSALPNASCLLAGYLPATTVLHILLIPNDYPLEFIVVDAVGTFLAIITMFLLLRMECTGMWVGVIQCHVGKDMSFNFIYVIENKVELYTASEVRGEI